MRKTLPRRPRKPLASARTLLGGGGSRYTTFDARHVCTPCSSGLNAAAGQHGGHRNHVGLVNCRCTPEVTLVLGGLLGQDVTLEGLTALDGATGTNAETLFRAALGLHLGHVNAPVYLCS